MLTIEPPNLSECGNLSCPACVKMKCSEAFSISIEGYLFVYQLHRHPSCHKKLWSFDVNTWLTPMAGPFLQLCEFWLVEEEEKNLA